MEITGQQSSQGLSEEARRAEKEFERLRPRVQALSQGVDGLEHAYKEVRKALEDLKADVGRVTPREKFMARWVCGSAFVCGLGLLAGAYSFEKFLLTLVNPKSILENPQVVDRAVTIYNGQATFASDEWPGSSLAWAAGLGFVGLTLALTVVAIGSSVALSRIGRE